MVYDVHLIKNLYLFDTGLNYFTSSPISNRQYDDNDINDDDNDSSIHTFRLLYFALYGYF